MKNFTFFVLSITLANPIFSQTGPGGVGTTDGTSDLVLWLDANTVSGTNASTITSWDDASGNMNNFTVGNGAVFNSPSINGYPAFSFNGTSHYFERAHTANLSPSDFTIFTATNLTPAAPSNDFKAVISNRDNPAGLSSAGFIMYGAPDDRWEFWTGNTGEIWQVTTQAPVTAGDWACQVLDYESSSSTKGFSINGSARVTNVSAMTSNSLKPIRVGAGQNETTPAFFFDGRISEIIMFNTVINTAQRIIIDNYLAAKYSYTLSLNDVYDEDDDSNTEPANYDHDVAGIGQAADGSSHTEAQGTGIVRILNATDLDNDEFLIWGHNNGANEATTTSDIPPTMQARFGRVWRVSEASSSGASVDVGAIDIRFHLPGIAPELIPRLSLLVDTDNDFTFGDETPISGVTNLGGNVYQFSGISSIANNLRFTIGILQNILPIDLLSFEAVRNQNLVKLTWATASEVNNDYFTIERSINGHQWEELLEVDAAGNSSTRLDYSAIDKNPYSGITYYRLKQVDFDKQYSYSEVKHVNSREINNPNIILSPNPTSGQVSIEGGGLVADQIRVFNIHGQDVTRYMTIMAHMESKVVLDLSRLSSGMYYLKTDATANQVYKY